MHTTTSNCNQSNKKKGHRALLPLLQAVKQRALAQSPSVIQHVWSVPRRHTTLQHRRVYGGRTSLSASSMEAQRVRDPD
jgi:hypothetical protein